MGKIFEYNKDIDKTAYMNWRTKQNQPIHDMIIFDENATYRADAKVIIIYHSLRKNKPK